MFGLLGVLELFEVKGTFCFSLFYLSFLFDPHVMELFGIKTSVQRILIHSKNMLNFQRLVGGFPSAIWAHQGSVFMHLEASPQKSIYGLGNGRMGFLWGCLFGLPSRLQQHRWRRFMLQWLEGRLGHVHSHDVTQTWRWCFWGWAQLNTGRPSSLFA